jgi:hypothetical protein
MNAIVIEHVEINELPAAWQARLLVAPSTRVTVRIEEEAAPASSIATDNPMFGMWQDREELTDVNAYVRQLRAPRYRADGSRGNEGQ